MKYGDRKTPWRYFLRYVPQYAWPMVEPWLEENRPLVTVKESEAMYNGLVLDGHITSSEGIRGKRLTQGQKEGLFRILSEVRRERLERSQTRKERIFRKKRNRKPDSWKLFICRDDGLRTWVREAKCLFTTDEARYLFGLLHGTVSIEPGMMPGGIPKRVKEEAARRFEAYRRRFRSGRDRSGVPGPDGMNPSRPGRNTGGTQKSAESVPNSPKGGTVYGDKSTPWLYFLRYVPQYAHDLVTPWLEEHRPLVTLEEAKAIYSGIIEGRISSSAGVEGKRLTREQKEGLFEILSSIKTGYVHRSRARENRIFRKDRKRDSDSWCLFVCHDLELREWVRETGCLFALDEAHYFIDLTHGTATITPEMMTGGIPEEVREEAARRFEQYRRNFQDGGFETVRESTEEGERIARANRRRKAQEEEDSRRRREEWEREWRQYLDSKTAVNVPDPFSILEVPRNASREDIRKAYRRKVKETHPDRGGSPEAFQAVQAAYQSLRGAVA